MAPLLTLTHLIRFNCRLVSNPQVDGLPKCLGISYAFDSGSGDGQVESHARLSPADGLGNEAAFAGCPNIRPETEARNTLRSLCLT